MDINFNGQRALVTGAGKGKLVRRGQKDVAGGPIRTTFFDKHNIDMAALSLSLFPAGPRSKNR